MERNPTNACSGLASERLLLVVAWASRSSVTLVLYSSAMKNSSKGPVEMVIAIVWYRPAQWQRVRDTATDAEKLEESYAEWLQLAESKFQELKSSGRKVEKVDVDSEKLILWCNERAMENDGKARSLYAAERLSELDKNRSLFQRRT